MNETTYTFGGLARTVYQPRSETPVPAGARLREDARRHPHPAVISNPKSHRNRRNGGAGVPHGVPVATPATREDLRTALIGFAAEGVDLIVVDGGDGTVRDVMTCAAALWGDRLPRLAVVPSGKTNALALDLGIPADWTVMQALEAARNGGIERRAPIEIDRPDDTRTPLLRGFLFGAGGFVRATELAQHTHRAGAFRGLAVAMAMFWAVGQTLFGRATSRWRAGDAMRVEYAAGARALGDAPLPVTRGNRYLLLASTLNRMPAGIKPFGPVRSGLKTLLVDAPPRRLAAAFPKIVVGSESPSLAADGYHRVDASAFELDVASSFILDGEIFRGGTLSIRRGAPIDFVVP